MERLFETHRIRKSRCLDGLWDFYPKNQSENRQKVVIPGCVETYPGFENYRGISVFEKELVLSGNIRFCFKGVSHTAEVFLDEKKIASHYNAYTPFETIVRDIPAGKHVLKVTADNSCHKDSALHVINDYFNYGGISRPVVVEEVADVLISYLHMKPVKRKDGWYGKIKAAICKLSEDKEVITLKLFLDRKAVCEEEICLQKGENFWEKEIFFSGVESYEPESPRLYELQAILEKDNVPVDDLIERVGFREISIREDKIFFNNKPLYIKGFNRHEDHALFGCALPLEAMDYDLRLIQETGANAVRTCHYPNDERFLDLCDEKGILVWEEGHARGLSEEQMRHPNFRSQSLDCLDEMVGNHYNHPCIFTWGILNECASETEYGREVYKEQYDRLRMLDDSRPLTSATCKHFSDICLDLPDIVSVNIYPGWYFDEPTGEYLAKEYEWVRSAGGKGKPFLISEIGAGGISGYRASHKPKWSEERQADILREQLSGVLGFEKTSGVFIWQFCDGRVPDENFYGRPGSKNNKGVVDEYRRKKLSFETVKEIFGRK